MEEVYADMTLAGQGERQFMLATNSTLSADYYVNEEENQEDEKEKGEG